MVGGDGSGRRKSWQEKETEGGGRKRIDRHEEGREAAG